LLHRGQNEGSTASGPRSNLLTTLRNPLMGAAGFEPATPAVAGHAAVLRSANVGVKILQCLTCRELFRRGFGLLAGTGEL
jgi:hypothetical protein